MQPASLALVLLKEWHQASIHRRSLAGPSKFRWVNTLLDNLKTSFSGTFDAFNFDKYVRRYLGGYCFHFIRRFAMAEMTARIANAVCCYMPCTERALRVAESYG
jgi:hypothetical protein